VYTHSSATALSLTEEQSGSLIFLDCSSQDLKVNLPPITGSAGLNYEFIISDSDPGTEKIKINAKNKSGAAEATLKIKQSKATNPQFNNVVNFNVHDTEELGDKYEVISDGTYWYFNILESSSTIITLASS